jgi:hypothetical protein
LYLPINNIGRLSNARHVRPFASDIREFTIPDGIIIDSPLQSSASSRRKRNQLIEPCNLKRKTFKDVLLNKLGSQYLCSSLSGLKNHR